MTSRASCAVGSRVQVADMFAQVGTCEPVAVGDGDWLTSADGDAVRAAEAVGDVWTAALPVVSQAAAVVELAAAVEEHRRVASEGPYAHDRLSVDRVADELPHHRLRARLRHAVRDLFGTRSRGLHDMDRGFHDRPHRGRHPLELLSGGHGSSLT